MSDRVNMDQVKKCFNVTDLAVAPGRSVTRPPPYFENSFLGRNPRRLHVLQLRISLLHPPNIANAYQIEFDHF